jgi:hypothetical protein
MSHSFRTWRFNFIPLLDAILKQFHVVHILPAFAQTPIFNVLFHLHIGNWSDFFVRCVRKEMQIMKSFSPHAVHLVITHEALVFEILLLLGWKKCHYQNVGYVNISLVLNFGFVFFNVLTVMMPHQITNFSLCFSTTMYFLMFLFFS